MAGISNNFSNNDVGDIGSHNKITVSAAFVGASKTAITLIAWFVILAVSAGIIYTTIAFTVIVKIVVPLLVGFVVFIGVVIGINLTLRHIARTVATISHARAQKERNALLGASDNFVVMRHPKTGEITVHSVTEKHENYHYSDKQMAQPHEIEQGQSFNWSELERE